ncbi:ribonuclease Z [Thermobispora bispora]|uniref:ribonuclease Z n=1 Tax=Thermobispora bispora TaxID=2006 RepID=UPI0019804F84|nr:ribonuclease Z [Thermobispora bispora]MBO2473735.1 ribonuclease Z [Actinomycetales bacterium]MBX6168194.1 ribonuclease Z [Thermobispora bispora]MDI9581168.1 ribonuclease Z [Thermobispora sp.]QSI47740.1 ribonuclease Z [Thermobispora bispora]
MSVRELVVLGTASAVPTRERNHNGYLLRWDGEGFLFDPGEGTQRQMLHAGVSAHDITWICVTHFHGDHCLGLPGVIQRIARDNVPHPVQVAYPAAGEEYWRRLRHASAFADTEVIVPRPVSGDEARLPAGPLTLTARPLSHPIPSYGYRIEEPPGRTMLPAELARRGIHGPMIGELQRKGSITAPDGSVVTLEECSVPRPGQSFAFVMDTRLCDAAFALADGVDLLVVEATFLSAEASLAAHYGHLTAAQAGRLAAACGVRRLVLTHFSERYPVAEEWRFREEAGKAFSGEIILARDLARIPVPKRRRERDARPGDRPAGEPPASHG